MSVFEKTSKIKTDSSNLSSKLALRRYFLNRYPSERRVLDCCQGDAFIWNRLREEFILDSYWGLDKKRLNGRLKIDSVRVLAQAGWSENVIDIDTYGSPWKHWKAMLPNVAGPLTVFLTCGMILGGADFWEATAAGVTQDQIKAMPDTMVGPLHDFAVPYCFQWARNYKLKIVELVEAPRSKACLYFGVRLEPTS